MSQSKPSGGTAYLILIQVASRALTFLGNQFLLRFLSPKLLGVAVQLELFSVSVLYFSRESVRVALQRQPSGTPENETCKDEETHPKANQSIQTQIIVNISYIAVILGFALTFLFGYLYTRSASTEVTSSPYFPLALQIYAIATLVELLSEPSFVVIQQQQLYKSRAKAETTAAILKCIFACLSAIYAHRAAQPPSVLPFAIGQLVYAVALLLTYTSITYSLLTRLAFSLLPQRLQDQNNPRYILSLVSRPLLALSLTLYAQSISKQLLTQGDALILSLFASLSDQGSFALASNYGGLLARLVFQPIEESSRNTFGALLSQYSSNANQVGKKKAVTHLTTTLHFYSLLTLLLITIFPTLLPILITGLIGMRFSTPQLSQLLSTYALFIPLMAYNGILDAFVTSVATPKQLSTQSIVTAACTMVYGATAWYFLRVLGMGATGLVIANSVGMGVRVVWGALWVWEWVHERLLPKEVKVWWKDALPSSSSVIAAMNAAVLVQVDLRKILGQKETVIAGIDVWEVGQILCTGVFLALAILFFERDFLIQAVSPFFPQRLASRLTRADRHNKSE